MTDQETKEYMRQYREKNRELLNHKKRQAWHAAKVDPEKYEAIKQSHRDWYAKNRKDVLEKKKDYAAKNVETLKAYRKANSERRVAAARKWQIANPERHKETQDRWKHENMHIIRKHIALRRARIMGATIGDPRLIAAWEKEWKSHPTATCEWCRMEVPVKECQSDHAEPLILGGPHNLDNLVISCRSCNSRKRGRSLEKWLNFLERELDHPRFLPKTSSAVGP